MGFLLIEQIQLRAPLNIDRKREMKMLGDVGQPPAACKSFFVISARKDEVANVLEAQTIANAWAWRPYDVISVRPLAAYRHNVDAMLIATYFNRPTINGVSTFNPPDWNFIDPRGPYYLDHVREYAARHRLEGLCGLDVGRVPHWFSLPPARSKL